jgi:hypothetical protein
MVVLCCAFIAACGNNGDSSSDTNEGNIKEEAMSNQSEITESKSRELLAGEDYLPIGTVVLLANSERKVMIIGVLQFNGDDQSRLFDYSGVLYPEGLIDPKDNFLFDKSQIERIYHLGYINEEQEELQTTIIRAKENYQSQMQ